MASDLEKLISNQLTESQSKYTYFLLAAAASAIALVVKRTTGLVLSFDMLPLGLSVTCWGWSFFSGCQNRKYYNSSLYANFALVQVQNGTHDGIPDHPQYIKAASEGVKDAIEINSSKANVWGHRQFRFLILGAIFFLIWHVLGMLPNSST